MKKVFVCIAIVLLGSVGSVQAQTPSLDRVETIIQKERPQPLLFDALKDSRFSAAYRKAFEAYWGLKWVSSGGGPTSPAVQKTLGNGQIIYVYSTCRPHACDKEYLYFVYSPDSEKGWGVLNIQSDIDAEALPSSDIAGILTNFLRVRK